MSFALRFTSVIAALSLAGVTANAGEAWFVEFEPAQAAARHENKDLLIDFGGSDWCEPCLLLKERVFTKDAFIERARGVFILLDIDYPYRNPIAEDRKQRYEKLQKRYGIDTFPSIVLASPDGRPYARTRYHEGIDNPEAFWTHLQPLRRQGDLLKAALKRAEGLEGLERANAIVDGLSEIHPGFVPLFYSDRLKELRELDPSDTTGYRAFLDGRKAVDAMQATLNDPEKKAGVHVSDVDAMIANAKLRGETLQAALVIRALLQTLDDRPMEAFDSFAAVLAAQDTRTRFDQGVYVPLDAASIRNVSARIEQGKTDPSNKRQIYYALHRIFEFDLPSSDQWGCGLGFQARISARQPLSDLYGNALLKSTEGLQGKERARALGDGLKGTHFVYHSQILKIVEMIAQLVGKEHANDYLPDENMYPEGFPYKGVPYYLDWLGP